MDKPARIRQLCSLTLIGIALLSACATPAAPAPTLPAATAAIGSTQAAPAAATAAPTGPAPRIGAIRADRMSLGRYERIELTVALNATFDQPYDSRDIALSAGFRAPSG